MHKSLAAMHQPPDTYFQTEPFATATRKEVHCHGQKIVRIELQNVKLGKFSQPGQEKWSANSGKM